jgi:ATP-dependent protease HslVU (ClpYQ) peptidase subunit
MTIVAACRFGRQVSIASDSIGTDGWGFQSDHGRKIERFKWGAVGFAGSYRLLPEVLDLFRAASVFDSITDALKVRNQIVERLETLGWKKENSNRLPSNDDLSLIAVSAASSKIFCFQSDFAVLEHKNYAAIGSGYELATGSMHSTSADFEVRDRARMAVKSAINHKASCGGRIYCYDFGAIGNV